MRCGLGIRGSYLTKCEVGLVMGALSMGPLRVGTVTSICVESVLRGGTYPRITVPDPRVGEFLPSWGGPGGLARYKWLHKRGTRRRSILNKCTWDHACHLLVFVVQMLDVCHNRLASLPDELSSLRDLEELLLRGNHFPEVPVSVLNGMTALKTIDLAWQSGGEGKGCSLKVPSLLPILRPGLIMLDLQQGSFHPWDQISMFHLGRAMAEVADMKPTPVLLF
jgi:hypothetical protein